MQEKDKIKCSKQEKTETINMIGGTAKNNYEPIASPKNKWMYS